LKDRCWSSRAGISASFKLQTYSFIEIEKHKKLHPTKRVHNVNSEEGTEFRQILSTLKDEMLTERASSKAGKIWRYSTLESPFQLQTPPMKLRNIQERHPTKMGTQCKETPKGGIE
jgi:hypothetical protein